MYMAKVVNIIHVLIAAMAAARAREVFSRVIRKMGLTANAPVGEIH